MRSFCCTLAVAISLVSQMPEICPGQEASSGDSSTVGTEQRQRVVYVAKNAPVSDLAQVVEQLLNVDFRGSAQIIPSTISHSLVISAAPDTLQEIVNILNELDRPSPTVSVQLLVAERHLGDGVERLELSQSGEQLLQKVGLLEREDKLSVLSRLNLTTLDNQEALVQVGERAPVARSSSFSSSRGFAPGRGTGQAPRGQAGRSVSRPRTVNYSMENVGTLFRVTPRVSTDGRIVMSLAVEMSRLVPSALDAGGEQPIQTSRTVTSTFQSTVTVPNGGTVVLNGVERTLRPESTQTVILLTAQVVDLR